MSDPILQFYFDQFENKLINSNTGSTTVSVNIPTFFRKSNYTAEIHVYYDFPVTSDLSSFGDWKLGIGNLAGGALIESTTVDSSNAATGVLVISNCNSSSVAFVADLGATATKQYSVQLVGNDGVDDNTIMLCPIYGKSTVY
jgi:hypothetical protein